MKPLILTNEYPPYIYGGAGIHVEYLCRELAKLCEVEVRCFGDQMVTDSNPRVHGHEAATSDYQCAKNLKSIFGALENCLYFNTSGIEADVVHVHTWYAHFGGLLARLTQGIPLALTVHSLEPLRPWKREQLGNGYDFTVWLEKTAIESADAVIAVSQETREDILNHFSVEESKVQVIYNGIDSSEYIPTRDNQVLARHGIDTDRPIVLFVGRITRQKGIIHLVNAIQHLDPRCQVVLCAGAPDTPEIAREMLSAVEAARVHFGGKIVWIEEMVPTYEKVVLYSHASVFCCPSIYEPFGIINLEAMSCETPVVASYVGGMKEIIIDGLTGLHVPLERNEVAPFEPLHPEKFSADLAAAINSLLRNPEEAARMGRAGRTRVLEHFTWSAIARETLSLYHRIARG